MTLHIETKKNQKSKFNHFWRFLKLSIDATVSDAIQKEEAFKDVTLPHDWLIYNTKDLYETSSGWYMKKLDIESKDEESRYFLRFDGVYMDFTVYLNNRIVGEWKNGYATYQVELTDHLVEGQNTIIVQVRHQAGNSRWYSGAGIYRDVWLIRKPNSHIISDGIYVHTEFNKNLWNVEIETDLSLMENGEISQEIYYNDQLITAVTDSATNGKNVKTLTVESPSLWSPDNPTLYRLETRLFVDGILYDEEIQNIGFKHLVMNPDKGLILNGRPMKIKGVCEHHDLGCLGSAFNETVMRKRMHLLKKMGVNAIRSAHSIPAPQVMDLADELGFLFYSEIYDMWERPKTANDYSRFFKEWANKDVASWIRRDRNHVSLLMWSIGNEIADTNIDAHGQEITIRLRDFVLKHDPKGNAPITIASNFMMGEHAQKCADIVKYAGYNYLERLYEPHHLEYPDWIIYGSETGSVVQSRGIYHFPLDVLILSDDDLQCSSLGNSVTSWGTKSIGHCITGDRDIPFSLGQFIWTGFDYIGEPTPYDTKNSYFGQIDTAGFPKDSFYVYQAGWTDGKSAPMVHIFPYWQFNESQMIDVRVVTNAAHVKLFLNNHLIGEKSVDMKKDTDIIPTWRIPFTKGELMAIAYDEKGNEVAWCQRSSFHDPATLHVKIHKNRLHADGEDVSEIEIQALDDVGNIVEDCKLPVKVLVEGAGVLLGLDNGDSTDFDEYKGDTKRMFSGKLKALVGSILEAGTIKLTIEAKGLEPKTFEIETKESKLSGEALTAKTKNHLVRSGQVDTIQVSDLFEMIPVQRIEIKAPENRVLSKDNNQMTVTAKVHPHNAKTNKLIWKVVNAKGVPSNIAKLEVSDDGCEIFALGDGTFTLKCMACNGKSHPDIISQLEFEIRDMGIAYKDPYSFISSGLYDDHEGEIGAGKDRGISTDNMNPTTVVFKNIDFGDFGSDTITMPIFAFDGKPQHIEIHEGYPEDEKSLLARVLYDKETIWNVYQEETYKLPKRLTGIKTLSFVFHTRNHFKGFSFKKIHKAYERLSILDCDQFYGDSFQKETWGMSHIGNNVTFRFENMDFIDTVDKIMIKGRSNIDKNSIRLQSTDKEGIQQIQTLEFTHGEELKETIFNIEPIKGETVMEFIFLPGSDFDFSDFRFIKKDE